jgi:hypothetical protein
MPKPGRDEGHHGAMRAPFTAMSFALMVADVSKVLGGHEHDPIAVNQRSSGAIYGCSVRDSSWSKNKSSRTFNPLPFLPKVDDSTSQFLTY